jgi:hypothetical protein
MRVAAVEAEGLGWTIDKDGAVYAGVGTGDIGAPKYQANPDSPTPALALCLAFARYMESSHE